MRLIDADALIEEAYWHGDHPDVDNLFAEGVDAVDVSDIDKAPTIEAEPVRHGRWKVNELGYLVCTNCAWVRYGIPLVEHFTYCPNCGVKLDKEA